VGVNNAFQKQYGIITRAQALAYGMSSAQIDYRVRVEDWLVEHPGVYRCAAVRPTFESGLLAATLRSGGLASHRCAASLWRLELYHEPPLEITVEEGKSVRLGVDRVHQSRQWNLRDETTRQGIRTTGIERTILDCAGVVGIDRAERLAEAAIRKKLTTWLLLADSLSAHSARGRNGCLTFRRLLQVRLGIGAVPLSDFSRRIVHLLVKSNIPTPVVEHKIVDQNGNHILQVDLAWPRLKKAWELDGLQWHFGREDIERDRRKRNAAAAEGWVIQEILWSMYVDNPRQLVEMAKRFLAKT
jgi:hypothetical protein